MRELITRSSRQLAIAAGLIIAALLATTAYYAGAYAALVMRAVK